MNDVLGIAAAALVAVAAYAALVRAERGGRRAHAVVLLIAVVVVDAALYENQSQVPSGVFHPGLGADPNAGDGVVETAFSFRLVDLLIVAALAARLRAGGFGRVLTPAGLAWLGLLVWLVGAAGVGLLSGHEPGLVAFQGKAVAYLAAGVLALGIGAQELGPGSALDRLVLWFAPVALVLTATHVGGLQLATGWPVLPLESTGRLSGDAATLFAALGILALALALVAQRRRLPRLLAAAALCVPTFVGGQRAALVGLAVALALVALAVAAARSRVRARPVELALLVATACTIAVVAVVAQAAVRGEPVRVPFAGELSSTFTSGEKRLSGASRVNQWREASAEVGRRPVLGQGLGVRYRYYDPGEREIISTDLTHNIGLDLLLRAGAIGLGLFGVALALSLATGFGAWRSAADDRLAALGLGAAALLAGLVAKGMFESLFEKYRLAILLALAAGLAIAPAVESLSRAAARASRRGLAWA